MIQFISMENRHGSPFHKNYCLEQNYINNGMYVYKNDNVCSNATAVLDTFNVITWCTNYLFSFYFYLKWCICLIYPAQYSTAKRQMNK